MPYYSILAYLPVNFQVRVLDAINIKSSQDVKLKLLFVAVGLYYGGRPLCPLVVTNRVSTTNNPIWDQELTFKILTSNLPREARICVIIYGRPEGGHNSNYVTPNDTPLAWVNVNLIDYTSTPRAGFCSLKLWNDRPAHPSPIGTCVENSDDNATILSMELFSNAEEPLTNKRKSIGSFKKGLSSLSSPIKLQKLARLRKLKKEKSEGSQPQEPTKEVIRKLEEICRRDSLTTLTEKEKRLLWENIEWCKKNTFSLPKLLLATDWGNPEAVITVHILFDDWGLDKLTPLQALELLDAKYSDQIVRDFSVKCLERYDDNDLFRVLLQLTQAVKFELYHNSSLARFLIERAFRDKRLGHYLFWELKSELHVPETAERFGLLLETYLKSCGKIHRQELLKQTSVFNKLNRIAVEIKSMGRTGNKAEKKKRLHEYLRNTKWPERFQLPLDPRIECSGFVIEKCRVMGSKTVPLWLAFKNAETGEAYYVIYKVGDDLRQDVLVLQLIRMIDMLWKTEGLDLKLSPYRVLAMGDECGMLEVVRSAATTSDINIEMGKYKLFGASGNQYALANWLRKYNETQEAYKKAEDTFLLSCAGYTVITYVLGLADRHNDNIMLTKQGHLFHIDFGHILGNYRKILGHIYADKADLVFIDQYYGVIGPDEFPRFVSICCKAYNILRKHANLFYILFSLILSSGLPEVRTVEDVKFLRQRFRLDLLDNEASKFFERKIHECWESKTINFNHKIHVFIQKYVNK